MIKSSLMFISLFINTLLYLNLAHIIVKLKLRFEFGLFTKKMNINKFFCTSNFNHVYTIKESKYTYYSKKKKKRHPLSLE